VEPSGGLLLVDKPAGITSFDIIRYLRRHTDWRKIGHAGTLDPMATGLMLILLGSATKQADRLLKQDKAYAAELTLGSTSSTGDKEGELHPLSSSQPTSTAMTQALSKFRGPIMQRPPAHSAIKVDGVRSYQRARRGEAVELPPRPVTIHSLELLEYRYPQLLLDTEVSSGTYIRSLAEDLGQELGTAAESGEC
jgi:tRNA pseudouridine55 synthase